MTRGGINELAPVVDALENIVPTIEVPVAAYYALEAMKTAQPAASQNSMNSVGRVNHL
jgi:hypothetical protein